MATKENRGDQKLREEEVTPSYALDLLISLLEKNKKGMFRKDMAKEMLVKKPALAKHIINGKIPFNLLFKKSILKKIKEDMPIKEQKKILESAQTSAKGLCYINLNKVSGIKRRIERREGEVLFTSSRHSGIQLLKYAPHDNVAQKMYDILSYNAGQAKTWEAHAKKFNQKCDDKNLIKRINLYTKLSMDQKVLPNLRDDVKVYTDTI